MSYFYLLQTPGKYKEALQDLTVLLKLDPQNGAAKKELETIKDLWREVSTLSLY